MTDTYPHSTPSISPPAPEAATGQQDPLALSCRHPPGLIGLSVTNFALRILTLGIYHFWAKTEVRKRLWSATRLNGEPFTYTGRGIELFLGFLIVFFLILLPVGLGLLAAAYYQGPESPLYVGASFAVYILFFFLIGAAIYRALRYRLARTRWRGIRGALEGSSISFAWMFFWTAIVAVITIGWAMPWRSTKLQRRIIENTRFGDRPLRFTAKSGPLYVPFAVMWFGTVLLYGGFMSFIFLLVKRQMTDVETPVLVPTPGMIALITAAAFLTFGLFWLIGAWYQARMTNHFANHTHFESATFQGNLTAGGVVWIALSNFLIMLLGLVVVVLVISAVVLPFVGFEAQEIAAINTKPGLQILISLVPLVILMSFTLFGPIIQARWSRYVVQHLALTGTAPLGDIMQSSAADLSYGEGLAEAFDVDAF